MALSPSLAPGLHLPPSSMKLWLTSLLYALASLLARATLAKTQRRQLQRRQQVARLSSAWRTASLLLRWAHAGADAFEVAAAAIECVDPADPNAATAVACRPRQSRAGWPSTLGTAWTALRDSRVWEPRPLPRSSPFRTGTSMCCACSCKQKTDVNQQVGTVGMMAGVAALPNCRPRRT
jgi:hypothetical protein